MNLGFLQTLMQTAGAGGLTPDQYADIMNRRAAGRASAEEILMADQFFEQRRKAQKGAKPAPKTQTRQSGRTREEYANVPIIGGVHRLADMLTGGRRD